MVEHTPYLMEICKLYTVYLNRPGEVAGLNYWQGYAAQVGGDIAELQRAFAESAEFKSLYAGKDASGIVDRAYNYLFGHSADQSSLQKWAGALNSGQLNVGTVVQAIADSAQGKDARAVELKVWASLAFTEKAAEFEPYDIYSGSIETQAAREWMSYIRDDFSYSTYIPAPLGMMVSQIVSMDRSNHKLTADAVFVADSNAADLVFDGVDSNVENKTADETFDTQIVNIEVEHVSIELVGLPI